MKEAEEMKAKGEKQDTAWWQPAVIMFAKFSGFITVPLLLGVFIGRYLDKRYDSEPWLFLISDRKSVV